MIREQISKFKIDRLFNYFTLKFIPGILTNILRMPSLAESFTNGVGGLKSKFSTVSEKLNINKIKNVTEKLTNTKDNILDSTSKFTNNSKKLTSIISKKKKKKKQNKKNSDESESNDENENKNDESKTENKISDKEIKKSGKIKKYKLWLKKWIKKMIKKIFDKIPLVKSLKTKKEQKKLKIIKEEDDSETESLKTSTPKSSEKINSPVDIKASIEIDNNVKHSDSEDEINIENNKYVNGISKESEENGTSLVSKSTVKGAIKHMIDNGVNSLTGKNIEENLKLSENSRTISENSLLNIGS